MSVKSICIIIWYHSRVIITSALLPTSHVSLMHLSFRFLRREATKRCWTTNLYRGRGWTSTSFSKVCLRASQKTPQIWVCSDYSSPQLVSKARLSGHIEAVSPLHLLAKCDFQGDLKSSVPPRYLVPPLSIGLSIFRMRLLFLFQLYRLDYNFNHLWVYR